MATERTIWLKTRTNLKSLEYDENWEKVIKLFENRIKDKFFAPIEIMLNSKNQNGIGFSILSIQCLLIELFATFRIGKIHNPRYNAINDPEYQFKDSGEIYTNFLKSCFIFENHFYEMSGGKKIIDKPYKAYEFYSNVRCGLLHEGKTKKNWTINLKPKTLKEKGFIKSSNGKNKIYRTILNKNLNSYFEYYLMELRGKGKDKEILRHNFARKMDNLYGFKPNKKFNWW